MTTPYQPPVLGLDGFNCPYCLRFAHQTRHGIFPLEERRAGDHISEFRLTLCAGCRTYALWAHGSLIFPVQGVAPPPNADMSAGIRADYDEANSIANQSPRGAAALLRLAIQKLCIELGEPGKDLNTDIGSLVKKGLPVQIQQALDTVRVIGNETVHPGVIDIRDNPETVVALFKLVNMIVDQQISQPKQVQALFSTLPATKLAGIAQRDAKK